MRFGAGNELQPRGSLESAAAAAATATAPAFVRRTQTPTAAATASALATPAQAAAIAATITSATVATVAASATSSAAASTVAFAAAAAAFTFMGPAGTALPTRQCLAQQSRHGGAVDRWLLCDPESNHVRKPGCGRIRSVEAAPQDCIGSPAAVRRRQRHSPGAQRRARRTRSLWPEARR